MKKIKAWAVLSFETFDLLPWGCTCNVKEGLWRYPIFFNRKEAGMFFPGLKVIHVLITPIPSRMRKK